MSELLIGTDGGLFRLEPNGRRIQRLDGPSHIAFLAVGKGTFLAVTREAALWQGGERGGWHLVNPQPVSDEIWSFAADPRLPGRLYLGVSPALLHRSDDGGERWTSCDSVVRIPGYERWTFPPPPHIPHVRSIAIDPRSAGALYIGVEEGGVYHSPDGGESWESLNESLYWDVHVVLPSPDGSARIYATTGAGFHRSDDGGRHWRRAMAGLDRGYTVPLAVSPERPDRLFTAAAASPPPGWARGANAAIYRSDDGGVHWVRLQPGLPARFDRMVQQIALTRDGEVYAAAGSELFSSDNGGDTWRPVSRELPFVRALAPVP